MDLEQASTSGRGKGQWGMRCPPAPLGGHLLGRQCIVFWWLFYVKGRVKRDFRIQDFFLD